MVRVRVRVMERGANHGTYLGGGHEVRVAHEGQRSAVNTLAAALLGAARRAEHPAHDLGRRDALGARDGLVLAQGLRDRVRARVRARLGARARVWARVRARARVS